jgi:trimeric autotransporter adhesin
VQIDSGRAYLDTGVLLDAEAGTLLGTFYTIGTTVATGPMVSDSTLGKNFILTGTTPVYPSTAPSAISIQAFKESDFTLIASSAIPVNGVVIGYKYGAGNSTATEVNGPNGINTLVRWGSNGLAFRAANGIFSVRSNAVSDLSTTITDPGVTVTAPSTAATGSNFTVTAKVTNGGPSLATGVVLTEALPSNSSFVSITPSQGSCAANSPVTCSLGNLAMALARR